MLAPIQNPGQVFLSNYGENETNRNKSVHRHLPVASGLDACDPWQTVAIALNVAGDAENAANEACLWLLWKRMGKATASLVIPGHPKLHIPDDAEFDAEEYEETISFGAHIVSYRDLD